MKINELAQEFPEAAEYIQRVVDEHGKAWVLENYYTGLYPFGVIMNVPETEDLPFYDDDCHESPSEAELIEMYDAWRTHRENLKAASEADDE